MFRPAQRDSLQADGADLVAAQPLDDVAEGREEEPDLALLSVVHVDVQVAAGAVGLRVDEGGALHLEALALEREALDEPREPRGGEGLLERHVVALHTSLEGCIRRWARSPSVVRMTRPSLSLSRRPAQKKRKREYSRGRSMKIVSGLCGSSFEQTRPLPAC
jgi:hypothetical protein